MRPLASVAVLLLAAAAGSAQLRDRPAEDAAKTFAVCDICQCRRASGLSEGWETSPFLDVVCDAVTGAIPELDRLGWPPEEDLEIHVAVESLGMQTVPRLPKNDRITMLSFYQNKIHTIYPNAFAELPNLQQLSLASNNLKEVIPDMFSKLMNLTELDLSDNELSIFNYMDFQELVQLERMLLQNNEIKEVPVEALNMLPQLEYLDISDNQIYHLGFGSVTAGNHILSKLKFLFVSGNMLTVIVKDTFRAASSLEVLNLSNNKIANIESDAFKDCTTLKELDLSKNQLKEVPEFPASVDSLDLRNNMLLKWPKTPEKLRMLDISENSIYELYNEMYTSLDSLQKLNISKNLVKTFELKNPLKSLKVFDFSYNLLPEVSPSLSSRILPALDELYLDGNPMESIFFPKPLLLKRLSVSHMSEVKAVDKHALENVKGRTSVRESTGAEVTECIDLYVSHCAKLEHIDEFAFMAIPICHLDLGYNKLSYLSEKTANWSSMTRGVNLQGNPWDCRCELQWALDMLLKDLVDNHPVYLHELRCESPRPMKALRMVHWYQWKKKAFCTDAMEEQSSNYFLLESEESAKGPTVQMGGVTIAILVTIAVALVLIVVLIVYLARGHMRHNAAVRRQMNRKRQSMNDAKVLNRATGGQNDSLTKVPV